MHAFLADVVLVLHAAFVLFVALGGLLALRWPRAAWVHLPAAAWGVLVEFAGWICPLTPLENELRARAARPVYEGDFIGRYLLPVLYPEGLTRETQIALGTLALVANVVIYALVVRRLRGTATTAQAAPSSWERRRTDERP
jgi:hypothetical protein